VVDFIDMESNRNDAMVERRMKEALRHDRARIQLGRISHFGLLEMSRQRLRPSLAETTFVTCPHCQGRGQVRSIESSALQVLRAIEEEGAKRRAAEIAVHAHSTVALYLLNRKRDKLAQIEARFGMAVVFETDDTLLPPALRIERLRAADPGRPVEHAPAAPPLGDVISRCHSCSRFKFSNPRRKPSASPTTRVLVSRVPSLRGMEGARRGSSGVCGPASPGSIPTIRHLTKPRGADTSRAELDASWARMDSRPTQK
jgi:hypothetical protein